jgi:hypothetical protein
MLTRQLLYQLSPSPSPFCFGLFRYSVMVFLQDGLDCDLPAEAGMTGRHHYAQLFPHSDGGLISSSSSPSWPGTVILPISASHIAGTRGTHQLLVEIGSHKLFTCGWP